MAYHKTIQINRHENTYYEEHGVYYLIVINHKKIPQENAKNGCKLPFRGLSGPLPWPLRYFRLSRYPLKQGKRYQGGPLRIPKSMQDQRE